MTVLGRVLHACGGRLAFQNIYIIPVGPGAKIRSRFAANVPSIEEVQGESAKRAASDVAVSHEAGLLEVSKLILLRAPPDSADQLGAVHTLFWKVD